MPIPCISCPYETKPPRSIVGLSAIVASAGGIDITLGSSGDSRSIAAVGGVAGGTRAVNQNATQMLVDKFRERSEARKPASRLPVRVTFPAVGPSLYVTSELTAENQSPTVELNYQKDKKGGSK